jgi:putative transposase
VTELLKYLELSAATYYRALKQHPEAPPRKRGPAPREVSLELRRIIIEAAHRHPVLGYKKLHFVLVRDGVEVSRKVVYRVLKEEKLLKRRHSRKGLREVARARLRELTPDKPNGLWQMDVTYIHIPRYGFWYQIDVIDYFSRYLLAQRFTASYSAAEGLDAIREAVAEAERLHGHLQEPVFLVTDNGSTFIARRFAWGLKELLTSEGADLLQHVRIGYRMPEHMGLLERFHGTLKAEVVWASWFDDPVEAANLLRRYGSYYNYERPHWALSLKTPAEVYLGVSWKEAREFKKPVLAFAEAA